MFSLVCGIVLYFFLNGVKQNETTLGGVDEKDAATSKIVVALNQLLGNREMYLVLAIMVVTLVIVYIIRKMSIEHAWAVAIIFGILFEAVGMIAGDMVIWNQRKDHHNSGGKHYFLRDCICDSVPVFQSGLFKDRKTPV